MFSQAVNLHEKSENNLLKRQKPQCLVSKFINSKVENQAAPTWGIKVPSPGEECLHELKDLVTGRPPANRGAQSDSLYQKSGYKSLKKMYGGFLSEMSIE